jgi:hypothetical protein
MTSMETCSIGVRSHEHFKQFVFLISTRLEHLQHCRSTRCATFARPVHAHVVPTVQEMKCGLTKFRTHLGIGCIDMHVSSKDN